LWRILCLLVAFGITLAIYVVWVITVGEVNAIQFVVVWLSIFIAVGRTAGVAYVIAFVGALVLAFPVSTVLYIPQQGSAQFTGFDLLTKQLLDLKTYIMIALYIVALCGALYLLRNRRTAG